jgi:hypothetical protein
MTNCALMSGAADAIDCGPIVAAGANVVKIGVGVPVVDMALAARQST